MEKYVVPLTPATENPKPVKRKQWKRSLIELNGKFEPNYRHHLSTLLMQSYCQVGTFPHSYHIDGIQCPSHVNWISNLGFIDNLSSCRRLGVSALEFDTKGIYLASVTKSGCLTVHDYESLYCQSKGSLPGLNEDEATHVLHISRPQQIDVVRWNLANQDESDLFGEQIPVNVSVACTSMRSSEVHIFDIGYISSEPVEVLRKKPTVSVHGSNVHRGLSDVAFPSNDPSRVLGSDTYGAINIWDRRASDLPNLWLTTNSNSTLNCIRLNMENQIVFGGSRSGTIYMWDLRGGRSSASFQSHKEVQYSPLKSVKLESALNNIEPLKAQSNIVSKEIHSININPSCSYQLAFHLDDGWSGVFDLHDFQVTHIHCPPPPWLDGPCESASQSYLRKPSWLPTYSIYAVGSCSSNGIHLLDFYPDHSSPCHVEYDSDKIYNNVKETVLHKQNRFLPLSGSVTACATHPLNGTIVAGTEESSLLMISQQRQSCQAGDDC